MGIKRLIKNLLFVYLSLMSLGLQCFCIDWFSNVQKLFCQNIMCSESSSRYIGPQSNEDLQIEAPRILDPNCCGKCSCDVTSCVEEGTCCLDAFGYLPTLEEIGANVAMTCDYPQLRPFEIDLINAGDPVKMFRQCKRDYPDLEVVKHCEFPELFNDLISQVPVVDKWSLKSYQNKFCAQCHRIDMSDIVYWDVNVVCGKSWYDPKDLLTNVRNIEQTKDCNLVYELPNVTGLTKTTCTKVISRCNETGLWKSYNAFIENACLAYTTIYNFQYKNVFCYMCNTGDTVAPDVCVRDPQRIGFFTFAALLKMPSAETPQIESLCAATQIYDPLQETCHEVICNFPQLFNGSTCVNSVSKFSGMLYEVFIELVPTDTSSLLLTDPFVFAQSADSEISKWLIEKQLNKSMFDVFSISAKLTPSILQSSEAKNFKDILHKAVAAFRVNEQQSDMIFLENIEMINGEYFSISLDVNNSQTFSAKISHWYTSVCHPFNTLTQEVYVSLQSFVSNTCYSIKNPVEIVTQFHFCPHVNLPTDKTYVEENTDGFFLPTYSLNLTFDETLVNISTVSVCLHTFQDALSKYARILNREENPHESRLLHTLSYVCVVLSVVFSALTFIVYSLCKELRNQPGINNMLLAFVLLVSQSLFQFGFNKASELPAKACSILGFLIHYSWLLLLMWMNVCTIHIFRVFHNTQPNVLSTNPCKTTLAYTSYALVFAAVPSLVNIVTAYFRTGGKNFGYGGQFCYVRHFYGDIYLLGIPAGCVIISNIIMYIAIVVTIQRARSKVSRHSDSQGLATAYAKLSTLTGCTWLFGFLYMLTNFSWAEYLFVILNATQGLFIFTAFIANKKVIQIFKKRMYHEHLYSSQMKLYSTREFAVRHTNSEYIQ